MNVEDFKKRLLEQLKRECEQSKSSFEKPMGIILPWSPLEIVDAVTIKRTVGEEPLVHYEEICDVSEAKNATLALWVPMRFFGRDVTYIFKLASDEKLNLTLFEKPEVHDVKILPQEVDKNGKPKRDYLILIGMMLHWATIIMFLIEHALKIIGKGA